MYEENCVFCKIIKGEIPSICLMEDEEFKVIMDISPAQKGHAVILPKSHAKNIFELDEKTASQVFLRAKKVAIAMKKALDCEGINILQNNGEVAGQTVFHFHMHVIPRKKEDTVKIGWKKQEYRNGEMQEIAEQIKKEL